MFLWLSSDVGKLLQVMDVPCMVVVELAPINHHWRPRSSMGWPCEVGEDEDGRRGFSHHTLGKLLLHQLGLERLVMEDRALGTMGA